MLGFLSSRGIFGSFSAAVEMSRSANGMRSCSVGKQIVNVPSFVVRLDSQKHIDFALTSPFGGGRPGRVRRKKARAAEKKDEGDGGEEEEE